MLFLTNIKSACKDTLLDAKRHRGNATSIIVVSWLCGSWITSEARCKGGALPWLSSMSADAIHQFVRTTILIWPQQDKRRGKWRVVLHSKHFARQNDSINVFQFDFNTVEKRYSLLILISIVEWSTISPLNGHKSARTFLMKWMGTQGMIPALQSWFCGSWITPEAGLGGGAKLGVDWGLGGTDVSSALSWLAVAAVEDRASASAIVQLQWPSSTVWYKPGSSEI